MQKVNSGDVSGYYAQQGQSRSNGQYNWEKDAANLIDAGASLNTTQQGGIAINSVSWNLVSAIVNGVKDNTPAASQAQNSGDAHGIQVTGSHLIDIKTAIADAVAQSLRELSLSNIENSKKSSDIAYKELFIKQVQLFAQNATQAESRISPSS